MSIVRKKPTILNRSKNKGLDEELTVNDTNITEMTENPWQVDSIQARSIKREVYDIEDTLYYKSKQPKQLALKKVYFVPKKYTLKSKFVFFSLLCYLLSFSYFGRTI